MRAIDADELLKRVDQSWQNAGLHGVDYYKFKKWVHSMPTIEAEPKHGRWEVVYYDNIPTLAYCNRCSQVLRFTRETETTPNYCPNCGAKMDEVTE